MAAKKLSGLTRRGETWHIDKQYRGRTIRQSCFTSDRQEAESVLIQKLAEIDRAVDFKQRQSHTFVEASIRFITERKNEPGIDTDISIFKGLIPYIGKLELDMIHDGTLSKFVHHRLSGIGEFSRPVKTRTVNIALQLVTRVLNRAARKWRDDSGLTWLETVPLLSLLDEKEDKRPAYPLSWKEQTYLINELPRYLQSMVLFKLNTGLREQEVCQLQWDWEVPIPELNTSVFLIPFNFGGRNGKGGVKNGSDRLVILNETAKKIIDEQRGNSSPYVFLFKGQKLCRINSPAFVRARKKAATKISEEEGTRVNNNFYNVRVHDLKHTWGHRLKIAGISFEDRQFLLGHKTKSVTSHYSAPELTQLIECANRVTETDNRQLNALTLIRRKIA